MQNDPRPAIYVDPKVAIELHQRIKTFGGFKTEEERRVFVDFALGDGLTDRDLVLFLLGKIMGIEIENKRFESFLLKCTKVNP